MAYCTMPYRFRKSVPYLDKIYSIRYHADMEKFMPHFGCAHDIFYCWMLLTFAGLGLWTAGEALWNRVTRK